MNMSSSRIDRLDLSAALMILLSAFVFLAVAAVVLYAGLQPEFRTGADAAVFRASGMSAPALFPSGRPERAPEMVDPRIDLRYSPFLPGPDPDPADMVFNQ